ncbi:MAG: UDP-N-acetylmuramoyl-tripeptide--D-alanyl-D-alanine ligase, partial [Rhodobacteraceae bacterium]|nr:UDP-N-acetylmuramoyl-tripeptide--D-alanyl-D-alanine ligase [Paracoccaceae bacterium]
MTPLWTAEAIAAATGGSATRAFAATGVSIDTRTLAPGDLFVALTDRRDGHDFVAAALAAGAAGALVARRPEGVAADAPLVLVADVMAALASLGAAARARTRARMIAVTGSAGKTSTKEMLRCVLAGQGRVHAAEASLNNHWGVPLTLARMPADAEFAVIEIGMNSPGEIAPLSRLARPDVALVTTVGAAHLGAFPDIEAIAREKAGIVAGLVPGGTAILPADIDTAAILRAAAEAVGARIVTFGAAAGADWRLVSATPADAVTVAHVASPDGPLHVRIASPGRHFAMNAVAALAATMAAGGDPGLAVADLGRWAPPGGRGGRQRIALDPVLDELTFELIDDAYNANPLSVAAALEALAALRPADGVGRVARG